MSDRTILIQDIKSIRRLEFQVPIGGVHVLCGANGAGKTTLMACLHRLVASRAFYQYFRTSTDEGLDVFDGSITYTHNNRSVAYAYGTARWTPSPKRNADVLQNFGFSDVWFIGATTDRLYTQGEELNRRSIRNASEELRNDLNSLFETNKYDDLRQIKVGKSRGLGASRRWNTAFLLPVGRSGGQTRYYSEKNFSLGEVLIVNLLHALAKLPTGSLLLIDEIELALHARVQVKLYDYLRRIARSKDITVIISTHSSSLINRAENLIFLQQSADGSHTQVITDCYPAYVLNAIGGEADMHPDLVILVEDDQAECLLSSMIERTLAHAQVFPRPTYRIMPIGGYEQVVNFARRCNETLFPQGVKVVCMLDKDVQPEVEQIRANASRTSYQHDLLNKITSLGENCRYMPITPELGMMDWLDQHQMDLVALFRDHFTSGRVDIAELLNEERERPGIVPSTNPRKKAKSRMAFIVDRISTKTNLSTDNVRGRMYDLFVQHQYPATAIGSLQQIVNPLLP